jgi:diguanylate cyclase (GGDEF)-like protein
MVAAPAPAPVPGPEAGAGADAEQVLRDAGALCMGGRYDEALSAVDALHARNHDSPRWQARAALLGAKIGWNAKRPETGLRWADVALDRGARLQDAALESEAWALKGACHALQPAPTLAVQCLDKALRQLSVQWPSETRRTILTAVGLSYQYLGLFAPATTTLRRAHEISCANEAVASQLRNGVNLCYALVESLDTELEAAEPSAGAAAQALRDEARALIARIDAQLPADAPDQLFFATRDATARLAMVCGDYDDALARLQSCLDRGSEQRPFHLLSWQADMAYAAHKLRRHEAARAWAAQARQSLARGAPEAASHVEYRRMARLAVVEGDAEAVLHWMRLLHARIVLRERAMLDARAAELQALETQQHLHLELDELRRRDAGLRQQFAALEQLARTDALTGLLNRRGFDSAFEALAGDVGFVLAIDLDHFKGVNDRFGHAIGDAVLQRLAQPMIETFRGRDRLGRLGGEEFVALLADTDEAGARRAAERLRARVQADDWAAVAAGLAVTLSAGLVRAGRDETLAQALARADAALYAAKAGGRNQVVCVL